MTDDVSVICVRDIMCVTVCYGVLLCVTVCDCVLVLKMCWLACLYTKQTDISTEAK
jgi:hypothetical protein